MAKQSVNKKYTISASGILDIDNSGIVTICVEDVGEFQLHELLSDFDGRHIKISAVYDEEQIPEDDVEIGLEISEE